MGVKCNETGDKTISLRFTPISLHLDCIALTIMLLFHLVKGNAEGLEMHSPIDIFAYKVYKAKILSNEDIRKMKYSMQVIWNEVTKLIILLFLFMLLDKVNLFIFSVGILFSIRVLSGGLHFKGSLICLMATLCFFSLVLLVLPNLIVLSLNLAIVLMAISTIIIYSFSPIPSSFRPIVNQKRKRTLKYLSAFTTLIWILILFKFVFLYNKDFFDCGIWTITIQAFQLIIGKGRSK